MESSVSQAPHEPVRLVVKHTFLELDAGNVGGAQEVRHERRRKSESSVHKTPGFSTMFGNDMPLPKHVEGDEEDAGSAMSGIDSRCGSSASQELPEPRNLRASVCSVMTSNGWEDPSAFSGSRRNSRVSQRGRMGLYQDDGDNGMIPSVSYKTDYGDYGDEQGLDPAQWGYSMHSTGFDAGSRVPLSTAPNFPPPMPPLVSHPGDLAHPQNPGYHMYPHYHPPAYGHPGYFPPSYGYPAPPWAAGYHHPPPGGYPYMPPPQQHRPPIRPSWLYPAQSGGVGARAQGGGSGGERDHDPGSTSSPDARGRHRGSRTTVMLRNIPWGFSRDSLTRLLDKHGFNALYDFVYMPMNFRSKASFGYAFVNLVSTEAAVKCQDKFNGFTDWCVETDKICEVSWSDMHQGLSAHIDRYRNSPVMHDAVPDEYKPVMYSGGVRAIFPPPTKKIRQPRVRRTGDGGEDDEGEEYGEELVAEERSAGGLGPPPGTSPPPMPARLREQAKPVPLPPSTTSADHVQRE